MPEKKQQCIDCLRHAEYYDMQETFDDLYEKSSNNEDFQNLMEIILSEQNILLAYRNIKKNAGSNTPGSDGLTIKDIGKMEPNAVIGKVRSIVEGSKHGYRPKPVRRVEIPKPDGQMRPLGIPCIWDRLIQQCIKQVMEPICEAKFSHNSYGFRPNRSVENAIQRTYQLLQVSNLSHVVEFDIEGFFDNVNHSKLIWQIWAMGIHDKHLIYIIKCILKAPIKLLDGNTIIPTCGTHQGGIISPLLANIVLNELDHWIESQWENNPIINNYKVQTNKNGSANKGNAYRAMRNTNLKEMYIVRYADDFRIFCRNKEDALRIYEATKQWLVQRLKLKISEEKPGIVNVREKYMEFLGFKIRPRKKGSKYTVDSHMCDKAFKKQKEKLIAQIKKIENPQYPRNELDEIKLYNSMVSGIHSYYNIATNIVIDCQNLHSQVRLVMKNRLDHGRGSRLSRKGRPLTEYEMETYGKSSNIRYLKRTNEPIYPISYVQHKNPMARKLSENYYTPSGREEIHTELSINKSLMFLLMKQPSYGRSAEFCDNKLSLFSAQKGKCAVTGKVFQTLPDIHCHHKVPVEKGGKDNYQNLVLVRDDVHRLIHATEEQTILKYIKVLNLNTEELNKLNSLRENCGNKIIDVSNLVDSIR